MTPTPVDTPSAGDVERIIDMIISAYHTTRLADTPAALHVRTRLGDRLTTALAALTPSSQGIERKRRSVEAFACLIDSLEGLTESELEYLRHLPEAKALLRALTKESDSGKD